MTDEECIAIAMLHGGYFWHMPTGDPQELSRLKLYFVIDRGGDENSSDVSHDRGSSPGDAARKYCIRHKLLSEVTNAASSDCDSGCAQAE